RQTQKTKTTTDGVPRLNCHARLSGIDLYDSENKPPDSKLAWLSTMQHYGVPTRLVDFTESPYVALYFAMEDFQIDRGDDMVIFAIDYRSHLKASIDFIGSKDSGFKETTTTYSEKQDEIFDKVVDRFSYDVLWITEPTFLNKRLDRQAGSFLLPGNTEHKIEDVLNDGKYANCKTHRLQIKSELHEQIFALLRKMNLTSKTLFGDVMGLAKSIKMEMQVYST
ncbi:MAG: FRG domain-containing protein, partial [Planctomycetota bacterium]